MNWYHLDDQRERRGPFDEAEIAAMIPDGRLKADTLVWNETLAGWILASESDLSPYFPPKPPPPPPPAIPSPAPGGSLPANPSLGCRTRLIASIAAGIVLLTLLIAIISAKACSTGSATDAGNGRPNYYQQQVEMMENMCRTCVGRGRLQSTCRGCGGAGTINTPSGYTTTCPQCQGTARVVVTCPDCGGSGKRPGS